MPETMYQIHNTTRSRETRTERRVATTGGKTVLLLAGGSIRVVRGRPAVVPESRVRALLGDLESKERSGLCKVTDCSGRRVDLKTLQVVESRPVDPPVPHPLMDSAANDDNAGKGTPAPPFLGEHEVSTSVVMPELLQGDFEEEPEPGVDAGEFEEEPPTEPETSDGHQRRRGKKRRG